MLNYIPNIFCFGLTSSVSEMLWLYCFWTVAEKVIMYAWKDVRALDSKGWLNGTCQCSAFELALYWQRAKIG